MTYRSTFLSGRLAGSRGSARRFRQPERKEKRLMSVAENRSSSDPERIS
jgi:hypothetical protein